MPELRNTYFNCQTADGSPVPWHPPDLPEGAKLDGVYFGRVLAEMDRRLDRDDLTVYITQNLERLPTYGRDVVVLHIGDEFTRVPAYVADVLAIFKNYAVRPALTSNVFRHPSWVNLWSMAWFLRTWAYHRPALSRYRRLRRSGWVAPLFRLPPGVVDQVPLPLIPFAERSTDLFFAGSVVHEGGVDEHINPKVLSRKSMMRHAERLAAAHPELSVKLVDTGAFAQSMAADAETYSRQLMDSRIALVPRGTGVDTFRFWQALHFGCVAVVDTLPQDGHFYSGAPVIEIAGWDELEAAVVPLLRDPERLEDLHRRSLEWWRSRASDEALGAYMADKLNALPS